MRVNKKKNIAWQWDRESAKLVLETGELLATLGPHSHNGYLLGVYDADGSIFIEQIPNAKRGTTLETKAMARVRFHLGRFHRESAKATRAEARRFRMFQTRSGK